LPSGGASGGSHGQIEPALGVDKLHRKSSVVPFATLTRLTVILMMDFHVLFNDFFDSKELSLTELVGYATVNVGRMTTLNPANVFGPRINATAVALANVEANTSDAGVKLALQKGATFNKVEFREALPAALTKIHAKVVAQYGKPSAELLQVFPEGLSGFGTQCRDEQLENKLQVSLAGLVAHQVDLGAPVVADMSGLLSAWIVLYAAGVGTKGAKKSSGLTLGELRKPLQIELTKNALFTAFTYPEDHAKCDYYLPRHLLLNAQAQPPGGCAIIVTAGVGQWTATATSSGAETIRWFRRAGGTSDPFVEVGTSDTAETFLNGASAGSYDIRAEGVNDAGTGPASAVSTVTVT
jgi:hypothetical protein